MAFSVGGDWFGRDVGSWAPPASDIGISGSTADGMISPGTCAVNCTNGYSYGTDGTGQPYSFHPTGANFAFGDGSVHFLQESIDIRVFSRLVTRAGNEVISKGDLGAE